MERDAVHDDREIARDAAFAAFFRQHFRTLVAEAIFRGATFYQADEAAQLAMVEVHRRWFEIENPLAFARRATRSHYLKEILKDRKLQNKIVRKGHARPEVTEDNGLNVWEDRQWVDQILATLPDAQREAMARWIDGLTPAEIGTDLGKKPATIRKLLQLARDRLQFQFGVKQTVNEVTSEHPSAAEEESR